MNQSRADGRARGGPLRLPARAVLGAEPARLSASLRGPTELPPRSSSSFPRGSASRGKPREGRLAGAATGSNLGRIKPLRSRPSGPGLGSSPEPELGDFFRHPRVALGLVLFICANILLNWFFSLFLR